MATILYVLHVLGAVLWVGGMAFAVLVLRPAAHGVLEGPQRLALMQDVFRRFFRVLWHVVPIILLTGWAIFGLTYWGFGASIWHVHLMNLTGIVMTGVFLYVTMVPWKAMRGAIAEGRTADAVAAMNRIRLGVTLNLGIGVLTVAVAAWGRFGG
ncbi:hypothetical protein GWK16_13780 [Roseomonas sp. JC162]|uniref:Copper resistance protein D domain-containing protein n=1 Tax=Neoroseomonas marina TaxID=1232220 RepID=A0A848EFH5_9PROT|nr:hypothetical protein [Neoroseomonas marina]NMJ42319.1 hypothetical protein [Neoroseomonas marina]